MNDKNQHQLVSTIKEQVAYELFKEFLSVAISSSEWQNIKDVHKKQNYYMDLFKACLLLVKDIPYTGRIPIPNFPTE